MGEEEDLIEETTGLRQLNNIKSYSLKLGLYNFESAWKDVKITTLANCWKKLMLGQDPELDFEGFLLEDFHQIFLCNGETDITVEDVENWFGEIAEPVINESAAAVVSRRKRWWLDLKWLKCMIRLTCS